MRPIEIACSDGYILRGHEFEPADSQAPGGGVVVIASATGVLSTYYHRYAAFLAHHGFTAVTFDYRGIGASAPETLRGFTARWYDWGYKDIDAALGWARTKHPGLPIQCVGHSFGGFGVGLARESAHLTRILTVGAQHAHWRDYAPGHRAGFWRRWHLAMPLAVLRHGYFPGRKRGWIEDLPRDVALDWARSRPDFTAVRQGNAGAEMRLHQRELQAPILAVAATDDPFATPQAVRRALAYTPNAPHQLARISPRELNQPELGHFALFHARFADSFWLDTLAWLVDGVNPWAHQREPAQSRPLAGRQ